MTEEQDNSSNQGSDLEENAKQWEKELASESGEEELSTDEDNQLTQDEESEEEEETLEDSEDEETEELEELEEEEPEEELFEVKSDGKTNKVSLQDLKDSYSKGQNYTRKSQALAEERGKIENAQTELSQLRDEALKAPHNTKGTLGQHSQNKCSTNTKHFPNFINVL